LFHSPPPSFRTHHHQNQRRAHRNAIKVAVVKALRLLKTGPSRLSSSSSEAMTTTPLPLPMGVGGGEALTIAKGITTMGAEEAGTGAAWGEDGAGMAWVEGGTGAVWVAGEAGRAEVPAAVATSSWIDRTSTN